MKYLIVLGLFLPNFILAQPKISNSSKASASNNQWIEKTIEVESEEPNATLAKRELIGKAIDKASEELIREIIGEAKYIRNHSLIQNKIIKNSARFVPLTRPGELQAKEVGFKLSVNMRVSQEDLQAMLLEYGLFYESDSTPILLPVVSIVDKISGRSWGWWLEREVSKADLQKISRSIEIGLKNSFWKNNFYVIRPQSFRYREMLPRAEDKTFLNLSMGNGNPDWVELADIWNAQILVQGEISLTKNKQHNESYLINIHLVANQVQNGRSIAEVVRQYETESGRAELVIDQKLKEVIEPVSQDLASQVFEAWQKGTIGSNLFKIAIKGQVPLQLQDNLKKNIKSQVHEIKNIKERLISMDEFVLEVDTNITPKDMQKKLPRLSFDGYSLKFESANEKEAIYRWSKEL